MAEITLNQAHTARRIQAYLLGRADKIYVNNDSGVPRKPRKFIEVASVTWGGKRRLIGHIARQLLERGNAVAGSKKPTLDEQVIAAGLSDMRRGLRRRVVAAAIFGVEGEGVRALEPISSFSYPKLAGDDRTVVADKNPYVGVQTHRRILGPTAAALVVTVNPERGPRPLDRGFMVPPAIIAPTQGRVADYYDQTRQESL